jgi:microcystin-dependent protein
MSEAFIGEIRMFAGNFAPRSWALCDGQLLAISQNDALFSLLGTLYGGDGRTTFGLPDMRGRVPLHNGQGPGLTSRPIGQKSGTETDKLSANEVAKHRHSLSASSVQAADSSPAGNVTATKTSGNLYGTNVSIAMAAGAVGPSGSASPGSHPNLMPTQCVTFIIALAGVYPSRN